MNREAMVEQECCAWRLFLGVAGAKPRETLRPSDGIVALIVQSNVCAFEEQVKSTWRADCNSVNTIARQPALEEHSLSGLRTKVTGLLLRAGLPRNHVRQTLHRSRQLLSAIALLILTGCGPRPGRHEACDFPGAICAAGLICVHFKGEGEEWETCQIPCRSQADCPDGRCRCPDSYEGGNCEGVVYCATSFP